MELYFNKFGDKHTRHFITIATLHRLKYFGEIKNGVMIYRNEGLIASDVIKNTGIKSEDINIELFVVMPDHIHVLICLKSDLSISQSNPIHMKKGIKLKLKRLDGIIRTYKATVSKLINNQNGTIKWQRGFHHRIITSWTEYENTKTYIINNPKNYKH